MVNTLMEVEIKKIKLLNRRLPFLLPTKKIFDKHSKDIFYNGVALDYFLKFCSNNVRNKWNILILMLFEFGSEKNIATHLHLAKFVPSNALVMFALRNVYTDVGTRYLYENFREKFHVMQKLACLSSDIPEIHADCLVSYSSYPPNSLWLNFAGDYFRGRIELLNSLQQKYPKIITDVVRRAIDCEMKKYDNSLWSKILTVTR